MTLILIAAALLADSGFAGLLASRLARRGDAVAAAFTVAGGLLGSIAAAAALVGGQESDLIRPWPLPWGRVWLHIDALSAAFLLPVFLVPALGSLYATAYWREGHAPAARPLRLFYGTLAASMVLVVLARDGVFFLGSAVGFRDLMTLAHRCGASEDPRLRQELARSYTRLQILKWLGWRARSRKDHGLGPEASVLKLAASRRQELDGDLVIALQGAPAMLYGPDALNKGYWQQMFLMQWSSRIGGGTEQVQRNVIGERVLGLPPDIRVDKEVAFRDLPG